MIRSVILFVVIGAYFVTPVFADAQSLASLAQCSGTDCSFCNLVHLANGLIKWLIGFLFILFGVLMAVAGFKLVTSGGNQSALDQAKESFTNAIIGLIIVLAAWLIVDTIMRGLVGGEGNEGEIAQGYDSNGEVTGWLYWSEVQCQVQVVPALNEYEVGALDIGVDGHYSTLPPAGYYQAPGVPVNNYYAAGTGNILSLPDGSQVPISPCNESELVTIPFMGHSVRIHKNLAPSLIRIDTNWQFMPNRYQVYSVAGYNCRKITNGDDWSNHAYGIALDINPADNPYGDTLVTDMPEEFVNLFLREGWGWGGNWNSVKDAMHFSKARGEQGDMRGDTYQPLVR